MRRQTSLIAALMTLVMLASSAASVWAKGAHVTSQAAAEHCNEDSDKYSGREATSVSPAGSAFHLIVSAIPEGSTDLPQSSVDGSCCKAFCVSVDGLLSKASKLGRLARVKRQMIASDKAKQFGDSVEPPPPRILAA